MNPCDEIRQQFSAGLDDELSTTDAARLNEHLESCAQCKREFDELQQFDQSLTTSLRIPNEDDAIRALEATLYPPVTKPMVPERTVKILAFAALVTIAVFFVFVNPFSRSVGPTEPESITGSHLPAADITRATGPVELMEPGTADWRRVFVSHRIPLHPGARIKTNDVLCEIETASTGRIRMNQRAELRILNASHVEVLRGQIWCESPASPGIKIDTPIGGRGIGVLKCPESNAATEFQCNIGLNKTSVASRASMPANWSSEQFDWDVLPNETVSIDRNLQTTRTFSGTATSRVWQLPLLAVGEPDAQELKSLLSPILSMVGRTKTQHMNETHIRELGPAAAIPLLMFVASDRDPTEVSHRHTAMRIATDIADKSAIKLLEQLATDKDATIAQLATSALKRLLIKV